MGVILRVDSRLMHGQVYIGWCTPLNIDTVVVVDDRFVKDEKKCRLQKLAFPGLKLLHTTLDEFLKKVAKKLPENSMVIVRSVEMAKRLIENGFETRYLNVGNTEKGEGKFQVAPTTFLKPDEAVFLLELMKNGVKVDIKNQHYTKGLTGKKLREKLGEIARR